MIACYGVPSEHAMADMSRHVLQYNDIMTHDGVWFNQMLVTRLMSEYGIYAYLTCLVDQHECNTFTGMSSTGLNITRLLFCYLIDWESRPSTVISHDWPHVLFVVLVLEDYCAKRYTAI